MKVRCTNYDGFDIVDLIDELKLRLKEKQGVNYLVHGAIIVGKDYYGACDELRKFLEIDDKRRDKL